MPGEVQRALATGALRTHVARQGNVAVGQALGLAKAAQPQLVRAGALSRQGRAPSKGASVQWRDPNAPSTPINRRLRRY